MTSIACSKRASRDIGVAGVGVAAGVDVATSGVVLLGVAVAGIDAVDVDAVEVAALDVPTIGAAAAVVADVLDFVVGGGGRRAVGVGPDASAIGDDLGEEYRSIGRRRGEEE